MSFAFNEPLPVQCHYAANNAYEARRIKRTYEKRRDPESFVNRNNSNVDEDVEKFFLVNRCTTVSKTEVFSLKPPLRTCGTNFFHRLIEL